MDAEGGLLRHHPAGKERGFRGSQQAGDLALQAPHHSVAIGIERLVQIDQGAGVLDHPVQAFVEGGHPYVAQHPLAAAQRVAPARIQVHSTRRRTHRVASPSTPPRVTAFTQLRARTRLASRRSEEHTSELQSLMRSSYAVFCLKKKTQSHNTK